MRSLLSRRLTIRVALTTVAVLAVRAAAASAPKNDDTARTVAKVEFIGEVLIPSGKMFDCTEISGLPSISYDSTRHMYYTLSDDQGNRSKDDPVRYYRLDTDISDVASPSTISKV